MNKTLAKELRIGNLFYYQSTNGLRIGSITSINRTGRINIMCVPYKVRSDNYWPIPLTEEILLKCEGVCHTIGPLIETFSFNLSKNILMHKELSVMVQPGNVYIYLRSGDIEAERHKDDVICIFNGDIDGKLYLHKLQNIIHSLSGDELKINL